MCRLMHGTHDMGVQCACALDGVKKRQEPTSKAILGVGLDGLGELRSGAHREADKDVADEDTDSDAGRLALKVVVGDHI